VSGAQIVLAAIAPTGQACDQSDPVEVVPERVGPNGPVPDVPSDQAWVGPNGPVLDVPNDQAQVGQNGPVPDVPSDLQSVRNGQPMHDRSGPLLVGSGLIGRRHRIRGRRQGRNRERAIAKRTDRTGKHAHSNVHVRNSKEGRGRRLNRHAAVVRNNGPARRERGLNREGINSNTVRRVFAIGV
jgi:hypothetical protein